MSEMTIESLHAETQQLHAKVERFMRQTKIAASIELAMITIGLREGERYAGAVLNDDGTPSHHLVLLPGETEAAWADAKAWAAKAGGELPTRREQSLLFANAKAGFKARWYWSSEKHESGSDAWLQRFGNGRQLTHHVDHACCARAVRRLNP